ncbi:unnamed protein product [Notodromas monacha]|uniref:VASt domain-containing protein n=1 Tax=Notodromas monacha TaxID=399045 RepID=A0A7R9BTI9_9CRUS|nr:unnamed protein product [Notodromas monacha]CAG0919859.1 unnamed protein product [Notodromas monacha]
MRRCWSDMPTVVYESPFERFFPAEEPGNWVPHHVKYAKRAVRVVKHGIQRLVKHEGDQFDLKSGGGSGDMSDIAEASRGQDRKVPGIVELKGAVCKTDGEKQHVSSAVIRSEKFPGSKVASKSKRKLVRQTGSDSTDSESTKSENYVITEPVKCSETQSHSDRVLIDVILPVNVDQAFTFLFTSSEFYLDFLASKKTHDIVLGTWESGASKGERERTANFKVPVVTPMGPRISKVSQKQTMISCSKPGHLYSINVEVVNGDIPYGDSFYIMLHFCIAKVSYNECRWLVTGQIKYRKSVWAVIRGFIEKNSWAGMHEYYEELKNAMMQACIETRPGIARGRGSTRSRLVLAKKSSASEGNKMEDESSSFLRKGSFVTGLGPGLPDRSLEVVPNADVSTLVARSPDLGSTGIPSAGFLSIILTVLVCLIFCNFFLFTRLWALENTLKEESTNGGFSGFPVSNIGLSELPEKAEEMLRLLDNREKLHLDEVDEWRLVISNSSSLLQKVEGILTELQERLIDHPSKVALGSTDRIP